MRKFYSYLYYRSFDFLRLTGRYDLAWGASNFLSLLISIFVVKVMTSIIHFSSWKLIGAFSLPIYFGLLVVNYFLFLKKEKYIKIIESLEAESPQSRKNSRIIAVLIIGLLVYSLF
jgi:hypothetical protein